MSGPTREDVERPTTLGAFGSKWVRLTDYEALAADNAALRERLEAAEATNARANIRALRRTPKEGKSHE